MKTTGALDDDPASELTAPDERELDEGRVLSVHLGPSANCSSIGSLVDFLFVSSVVGGAVVSAVAVLLRSRRADEAAEPEPSREEAIDEGEEAPKGDEG